MIRAKVPNSEKPSVIFNVETETNIAFHFTELSLYFIEKHRGGGGGGGGGGGEGSFKDFQV